MPTPFRRKGAAGRGGRSRQGGEDHFEGISRCEARGVDCGIGAYRGDPLYHASLDVEEYARLLDGAGFELLESLVGDVEKGGRVVWIAQRR